MTATSYSCSNDSTTVGHGLHVVGKDRDIYHFVVFPVKGVRY